MQINKAGGSTLNWGHIQSKKFESKLDKLFYEVFAKIDFRNFVTLRFQLEPTAQKMRAKMWEKFFQSSMKSFLQPLWQLLISLRQKP